MTFDFNGKTVVAQQMTSTKSMWRLSMNEESVGCIMIYVDDVLIIGSKEMVEHTIGAFVALWECKITGILLGETERLGNGDMSPASLEGKIARSP